MPSYLYSSVSSMFDACCNVLYVYLMRSIILLFVLLLFCSKINCPTSLDSRHSLSIDLMLLIKIYQICYAAGNSPTHHAEEDINILSSEKTSMRLWIMIHLHLTLFFTAMPCLHIGRTKILSFHFELRWLVSSRLCYIIACKFHNEIKSMHNVRAKHMHISSLLCAKWWVILTCRALGCQCLKNMVSLSFHICVLFCDAYLVLTLKPCPLKPHFAISWTCIQ